MKKVSAIILPLAFGLFALWIWEAGYVHQTLNLKPFQLPVPSQIVKTLYQNYQKALSDCWVTLSGAFVGMWIGSFIGFAIALIATCFKKWGYGGMILITAFNAIPIVALSPIMNLWFSQGFYQKVGVVTVVCMAAMAINAYQGMNQLKPFALDLMQVVSANPWTVFLKLRLPNALPYIFTAFRINIAASLIAAIISEYFSASTSGLGFGIKDNLRKAEMAMGWSYIVVASLAGVVLYFMLLLLERRAIKWHASQR